MKFIFLSLIFAAQMALGSVSVTVNGSTHTIPQTNERGWGNAVTAWIQAISSYTLQPTGGTFTLTADTDFGANYGLKAPYYLSRATNVSTSGILRLGNAEYLGFRNAANGGNLLLGVNASDQLTYNGVVLASSTGPLFQDSLFNIFDDGDATKKIAFQASGITTGTTRTLTVPDASGTLVLADNTQTLTGKTLSGNTAATLVSSAGTLTLNTSGNVTVPNGTDTLVGKATTDTLTNKTLTAPSMTAPTITSGSITTPITANKALTTGASGVLTASATTDTELGYVSGVTSAIQTQINAKAPSASPTFTGTVTTPATASRALVTGASSELTAATTTATEIGYVNGVTSAIQTQLDAKVAKSTYSAKGSILAATAASTPAHLAVGTDGTFLKADSAASSGVSWASVAGTALALVSKTTTYTATTSDDIITVTTGAAWTLTLYAAAGNSGKILRVKKTSSDVNALTIDGNASETIDGATTTTINTQYEEVTLACDGSNWHIVSRTYPSVWVAYTPTFTGFGTPSNVSFVSRRVGDSLEIVGSFTGGTSTAVEARVSLGFNGTDSNVTSSTTKITNTIQIAGMTIYSAAVSTTPYALIEPTKTYLTFGAQTASTAGFTKANGNTYLGSGTTLGVYAKVAIAGWN